MADPRLRAGPNREITKLTPPQPGHERWGERAVHRHRSLLSVQTNDRVLFGRGYQRRLDELKCRGNVSTPESMGGVRLRLNVRMLRAEGIETLIYGCVTWRPSKTDYGRLREAHHKMNLRCIGWRKRKRGDHMLSYASALLRTNSESVETGR